jgi:anti-sigma B factor antagonist
MHQSEYWEIKLPKKVYAQEGGRFFTLICSYLEHGHTKIVADAGQLVHIDSRGVGYMVSALKETKERQGTLVLRDIQGQPQETFTLVGLLPAFTVQQGEDIHKAGESFFSGSVDIKLDLSYELTSGGRGLLHFAGVMNSTGAVRRFKEQMLLACRDSRDLVLDFERLTMFDSNALGMLANVYKMLRDSGGSIRIAAANDMIESLLASANLQQYMPCFATVDDALYG